jgi:type VI protein secretion system component Hcp
MKNIHRVAFVFAAAISAASFSAPASAALNAYLQIPGISGETHEGTPAGAISVESFSWGASQTARETGSGMATGRRQHQPIVIMKRIDKASPMLMQAAVSGRHFQTIVLNANGQVYRFQDAIISSDQHLGNGQSETITIDYAGLAGESTEMMSPQNTMMRAPTPTMQRGH